MKQIFVIQRPKPSLHFSSRNTKYGHGMSVWSKKKFSWLGSWSYKLVCTTFSPVGQKDVKDFRVNPLTCSTTSSPEFKCSVLIAKHHWIATFICGQTASGVKVKFPKLMRAQREDLPKNSQQKRCSFFFILVFLFRKKEQVLPPPPRKSDRQGYRVTGERNESQDFIIANVAPVVSLLVHLLVHVSLCCCGCCLFCCHVHFLFLAHFSIFVVLFRAKQTKQM